MNELTGTGRSRSVDLLSRESHFEFGKNWQSYSQLIAEGRIEKAVANLRELAGGTLSGRTFLDIGCGSGLQSLAALRLGAREVLALDIDPESVATTRGVLRTHAAGQPWRAVEMSVFDLEPDAIGRFDVVHSWGVLHHTGDMYRALHCAAALVAPGGQFIFALYRRTRLCWFWKREKRWYASAGPRAQRSVRALYVMLYRLKKGKGFAQHVAGYNTKRGMDFYHDLHDWLGGWPYESTTPAEVETFMRGLGMHKVRAITQGFMSNGLTGTGCDQFVYARREARTRFTSAPWSDRSGS